MMIKMEIIHRILDLILWAWLNRLLWTKNACIYWFGKIICPKLTFSLNGCIGFYQHWSIINYKHTMEEKFAYITYMSSFASMIWLVNSNTITLCPPKTRHKRTYQHHQRTNQEDRWKVWKSLHVQPTFFILCCCVIVNICKLMNKLQNCQLITLFIDSIFSTYWNTWC
jgi:hypothetical protein